MTKRSSLPIWGNMSTVEASGIHSAAGTGFLLEIKDLAVYYDRIQATWDVSVDVEPGAVTALVGSNGAGKTAVMKAVSGVLPYGGSVRFQGEKIDSLPSHKRVELGLSLVPEGRKLFPLLTVQENLEIGAFVRRARNAMGQTMDWFFQQFPVLTSRRSHTAGSLSGGEQQMLAIGRGLMARPRLLMLDEPSLGLAPLMARQVFRIIESIHKEEITVFLVEQNVRQTLELSNQAYVLENGQITLQGLGRDMLRDDYIREAYLGL